MHVLCTVGNLHKLLACGCHAEEACELKATE